MTWLRPQTASSIASWPGTPVVYQRPVLRASSALFLLGLAALHLSTVWFPPQDDPLLASDWWVGPAMFLMLGGLYLYCSSRLMVTATQVLLENPLRRVAIPLGQVTAVTPGENLKIETAYGHFYAWGVEAAQAQMMAGDYGTQGNLVTLIERAAKESPAAGRPARYRWRLPDPFFLVVGVIITVNSVALNLTGPSS